MAKVLHITTPDRIATDLLASLLARGVDAGETFGEFVAACRRLGITDSDRIASIEFGCKRNGHRVVIRQVDDAGAVEVFEL